VSVQHRFLVKRVPTQTSRPWTLQHRDGMIVARLRTKAAAVEHRELVEGLLAHVAHHPEGPEWANPSD
jgi:hypothetical protein